jgi:hypothetical protein
MDDGNHTHQVPGLQIPEPPEGSGVRQPDFMSGLF